MRCFLAFTAIFLLNYCTVTAQDTTYILNEIEIEGNKTTKKYIVEKELTFKKGDITTISDLNLKITQSKKNLINTSLFHFVDVELSTTGKLVNLKIKLKERWYTWPKPILLGEDRNVFDWLQYRTFDRFSYGLFLNRYNFRGRQETIQLKLKFGYSQELGLLYKIPYLIKTKNHGLTFSFLAVQRHEIYYKSINDKITYYKNHDAIMRNEFNAFIEYVYRFHFYNQHIFRADFDQVKVGDTIVSKAENPNYLINGRNNAKYFSLKYMYKIDKRDSKNYPLSGYDIEAEIKKYGLNLSANEINTLSFIFLAEKFGKINNRFYYGGGLKTRYFTTSTTPFYIARGLGFNNDYVRGYEPYLISGNNFVVAKSNIKWQIFKPKIFKVPYLKWDKFNTIPYAIYLTSYVDAGYIQDKTYTTQNNLANNFLIGYGMGLDFVSYYDTVCRVEFSTNKKGQSGIYVSFIAPI